jgi:hypothetical protein
MTSDTAEPGLFRRLLKKVVIWEEALNYSGFDYTFDRLANVERELAALKDRMRQIEASQQGPPDAALSRRPG